MSEILKDILMVVGGIMGGYLFIKIRQKIINSAKETASEKFSLSKFLSGIFNLGSSVAWSKDFSSIFNLRKICIVGVIVGVIYGFGWYQGKIGKEVLFDMRGKEAKIKLNEHFLKIEKDGTAKVVDKDGKVLKTIRVKDVDGLRQALRPYGFQLKPVGIIGGSVGGESSGFEGGVGISWFKYFKWNLDSFLTNRGIYPLATSYQITDNSGIGIGVGCGYDSEKRIIVYYRWRF